MFGRERSELVPFEKNKKVIRLEDRGRERELIFGEFFFGILAFYCLLYFAGIGLFVGYGTRFFLIWGAIGIVFGGIAFLCAKPSVRRKIPVGLIRLFWICFGVGLAIFLLVEGLILSRSGAQGAQGADYVIVLGAQWRTSGPSRVLKYRLDKALEYWLQNPDAKVIVSGGQGANEPIAEADGMFAYLVQEGIPAEQILIENRSVNTYENLRFSGELLDKEQAKVVIVTNDFHVFRAEKLAQAQGYRNVCGIAAPSYALMQPNNLLREFFGVTKDFLMGNLLSWD